MWQALAGESPAAAGCAPAAEQIRRSTEHEPFSGTEEVLRKHSHRDEAGDQRPRGADPGGAREGEGPPRGAPERAESGPPDVRRRMHAARHTERPRGSGSPGLSAARRRGNRSMPRRDRAAFRRRPLPAAAALALASLVLAFSFAASAPSAPSAPERERPRPPARRVVTLAP